MSPTRVSDKVRYVGAGLRQVTGLRLVRVVEFSTYLTDDGPVCHALSAHFVQLS